MTDTLLCDIEGVPYKEFQNAEETRVLEQRLE